MKFNSIQLKLTKYFNKITRQFQALPIWSKILSLVLVGFGLLLLIITLFSENAVWRFIPNEAFAVVEITGIQPIYAQIDTSDYANSLQSLPHSQSVLASLELLDSISNEILPLKKLLQKETVLISAHVVAKSEIGFLFFVPVGEKKQWLFDFAKLQGTKWENRKYKDTPIWETKIGKNNKERLFSFIEKDNWLIGSFHGFLVEDVIRMSEKSFLESKSWDKIYRKEKQKKSTEVGVRIHWNHEQVYQLAQSVFRPETAEKLNKLARERWSSWAKLDFSESKLTGNGKTVPKKKQAKWKNQKTKKSNFVELLPANIAYFTSWNFSDSETFWKIQPTKDSKKQTDDILGNFGLETDDFTDFLGGELTFSYAGFSENNFKNSYILVGISDDKKFDETLEELAESTAFLQDSTQSNLTFKHHSIGIIPFANFPQLLFGTETNGEFEKTYHTKVGDYWLLANSSEAVIDFLENLGKGNVLKNKISQNGLDALNSGKHFTLFIQPIYLQLLVENSVEEDWGKLLWKNRNQFKQWQYFSLQSDLHKNTFHFQLQPNTGSFFDVEDDSISKMPIVAFQTKIPAPTASKPYVFESQTDSSKQVFVLDKWKRANLISKVGKRNWSVELGNTIGSEVFQVDWFGNGKRQFMFAIGNKISLMNRFGRSAYGFPIYTPARPISQLSLFDFKQNGSYQVAVADKFGNVSVYNKFGKARVGWQSKKLDGELATEVKSIRVGKEFLFVIAQKSGIFNVFDQFGRGEAGFPLSFTETLIDFTVENGDSSSNSFMNLLTQKGNLLRIDLNGKVVETQNLPRSQVTTRFKMIFDESKNPLNPTEKKWLVSRQEGKQISIFNPKGTRLFNKQFETEEPKIVQYFHFGLDAEIVAITSPEIKTCRLYFIDGSEASIIPFLTNLPISIVYSELERAYFIYFADGNNLSVERLGI